MSARLIMYNEMSFIHARMGNGEDRELPLSSEHPYPQNHNFTYTTFFSQNNEYKTIYKITNETTYFPRNQEFVSGAGGGVKCIGPSNNGLKAL